MTPAVDFARRAGIEFELREYTHDPGAQSYGLEAAEALGLDPAAVYKTLVVAIDGRELAVAILPVESNLDLKAAAAAFGARRAAMADPLAAQRATGYVLGAISPLGQKRRLRTVLDASALEQAKVYVSGGRRGLEIGLAPTHLVAALGAITAPVARYMKRAGR